MDDVAIRVFNCDLPVTTSEALFVEQTLWRHVVLSRFDVCRNIAHSNRLTAAKRHCGVWLLFG